ncbi:MAG: HupE/UreJ family protein [Bacteroidia bacterium]
MNQLEILLQYLSLGFTHVIPYGYDHLLFIVSIIISSPKLKKGLLLCTIFTISHSISLGFAASGLIIANPAIIEPLIAISILLSAISNLFQNKHIHKEIILFVFGLIHGLGFANALKEVGLNQDNFLISLFSFNIGVELAQIAIVLIIYFTILKWFSHQDWYERKFLFPVSSLIGCFAMYWTIDRILNF